MRAGVQHKEYMNIMLSIVALSACAVSVEPAPAPAIVIPDDPAPVELVLFGGWVQTDAGLRPLEGSALIWIEPSPCALEIAIEVAQPREAFDRWGVSIFHDTRAAVLASDSGAAGAEVLEVDAGAGFDCTAAIAPPGIPADGDLLVSVTALQGHAR